MTTDVMVPLDGSPAAEGVLPWAIHLARQSTGVLRLVGVHAPPAVLLDGETLIGSVVPDDSIRQREIDYFAALQTRLKSTGLSVTADLLDGSVVSSLAEHAKNLKPAWVVMLSHARGALARFFLGETAREFVRESPSPVLLIHPDGTNFDLNEAPVARRVLVPLDGSELAESMIRPATAFAKAIDSELTFMMALAAVPDMEAIAARHEPGLPGPWDPSAAAEKARLYLEHHADRIRAASMQAKCLIVPEGDAASVIITEANAHPGTVVALATHGRGGLAKMVWGSVTDKVVRQLPSPVLVLHPSSEVS
jgi:nucleotide-binding universal stress UspA family protein